METRGVPDMPRHESIRERLDHIVVSFSVISFQEQHIDMSIVLSVSNEDSRFNMGARLGRVNGL